MINFKVLFLFWGSSEVSIESEVQRLLKVLYFLGVEMKYLIWPLKALKSLQFYVFIFFLYSENLPTCKYSLKYSMVVEVFANIVCNLHYTMATDSLAALIRRFSCLYTYTSWGETWIIVIALNKIESQYTKQRRFITWFWIEFVDLVFWLASLINRIKLKFKGVYFTNPGNPKTHHGVFQDELDMNTWKYNNSHMNVSGLDKRQ